MMGVAVASAGPYANHLHIAADRQPRQYLTTQFLGHRLGDDLVDWNSGVSVRPSVRPYVHKKFFRFPSNLVCG